MVVALTSTSSSLFVNLRKGVGILTLALIKTKQATVEIRSACNQGQPFCSIAPRLQWLLSSIDQRLVLRGQQALEFAQARFNLARLAAVTRHRIESFQSVAGDAENGRIFGGNPAAGNEFLGHTQGHSTRRFC